MSKEQREASSGLARLSSPRCFCLSSQATGDGPTNTAPIHQTHQTKRPSLPTAPHTSYQLVRGVVLALCGDGRGGQVGGKVVVGPVFGLGQQVQWQLTNQHRRGLQAMEGTVAAAAACQEEGHLKRKTK